MWVAHMQTLSFSHFEISSGDGVFRGAKRLSAIFIFTSRTLSLFNSAFSQASSSDDFERLWREKEGGGERSDRVWF